MLRAPDQRQRAQARSQSQLLDSEAAEHRAESSRRTQRGVSSRAVRYRRQCGLAGIRCRIAHVSVLLGNSHALPIWFRWSWRVAQVAVAVAGASARTQAESHSRVMDRAESIVIRRASGGRAVMALVRCVRTTIRIVTFLHGLAMRRLRALARTMLSKNGLSTDGERQNAVHHSHPGQGPRTHVFYSICVKRHLPSSLLSAPPCEFCT